jgi:hypothetical protein
MRKILLLTLGGAVGYVLGARAGRPAYDRLVARWSEVASTLGLTDVAATVKEAGIDVRDSAVNRASAAVSTSADGMAERIDADGSAGRTEAPGTGSPTDGPVVTPVGSRAGGL